MNNAIEATSVSQRTIDLVNQLIDEYFERDDYRYIKDFSTYQQIKNETDEIKAEIVFYMVNQSLTIQACLVEVDLKVRREKLRELVGKQDHHKGEADYYSRLNWFSQGFVEVLMKVKIVFKQSQWITLINQFRQDGFNYWPLGHAVKQLGHMIKEEGLTPELEAYLREMLTWKELTEYGSNWKKLRVRLVDFLSSGKEEGIEPFVLSEKEDFGKTVNQVVSGLEADEKELWYKLFMLAATSSGATPSKKFSTTAKELVGQFKRDRFRKQMQEWLTFVSNMSTTNISTNEYWPQYIMLDTENGKVLKGLVWSLVQFHDSKTLNLLAIVAEKCYKKIPGVGPAAAGVGNASLYTLANSRGIEGISHLSRLRVRVKQSNTQSLIDKYVTEAAAKLNISEEEIEDLSVPTYGLQNWVKEEAFKDYTLRVSIEKVGKVSMQWVKPDGALQKSVPVFVKQDEKLKEKLKVLKEDVKQLQNMLSTQRDRFDSLFIQERSWLYENFEKYYLNHALTGFLTQKMIWTLEHGDQSVQVLWLDEKWQDVNGIVIDWVNNETKVSLWHPIHVDADTVLAWRTRLEELNLQQPIKQAFREIYILTDAERNTNTYSNRMAAHILKQHQLNALASVRGWKYSLMGYYDGGNDDERVFIELPKWGLVAEFWVNAVAVGDAHNTIGMWLYVSTDQLRFKDKDGTVVPLADIPTVVFSEVMRDVDLFVGVCSVGNDPEWRDSGELPQYHNYWSSYSFGDLTEIAKNRKGVLERLVPRLKIKSVAKVEDKFLHVKGKIRNYKIHIGSGNILMEPNDQYLCIVAARGKEVNTGKVFLPFEGDTVLSLILSKAMLLAEDDKIKDPTIVSQLTK
ncbi:DUF4132 domain-containing protein [Limibacter armeniacum]|uniref:DUF4132 domain-containing protein n=1 Tax=Limibacter armeniacum TaxID=466084 RepID=UPI002FE5A72D